MSYSSSHSDEISSQPNEDNRVIHHPQVILIDESYQKSQESHSKSEEPKEKAQSAKSPLSLRFLCVLGLIFCSIFGLGVLLMSLFSTFMSTLYLFRKPHLNQGMRRLWKLTVHTAVAGFGFVLGLISPTLGLGLIALYFSVTGEVIDNNFLHQIIKRSFNKF